MIKEILKIPHSIAIMEILYEGEQNIGVVAARLKKNYYLLKKSIKKLEDLGLIKEEAKGKGVILSLTDEGRKIYNQINSMEKKIPEELEAQRKRLHWIVDINTYTDHITAYDIHGGKKEIFNIWLKPNGKYLVLYCDLCHSYSCFHIDWALQDPVIGSEIREIAKKKGLKIKNNEE